MKTQHTPGSWHSAAPDIYQIGTREFIGIGNGSTHIGYASVTCNVRLAEAKANARLFAAAPELLQACKDLIEPLSDKEIENCWQYKAARKAIAKAQ